MITSLHPLPSLRRLATMALSLLCLACPLYGIAQEADTLVLDLQQAISLALEQSPSARSARHSFLSQHWNYRNFRANYLPSVTLSSSPYINNQINKITQSDGSSLYLRQSQLGADLNLSINQNISWTGGTFFVKSTANYHRELSNHTNMFSTVPISIGYSQSLFGYNSLKWDKRIEPLRYTEAKKSYAETIELVSASTCSYFFNLATAQSDLEMARSNFASADTLYRMAQGRYKIGTITENEMLQLEIRRLSEETSAMDAEISLEASLFGSLEKWRPVRECLDFDDEGDSIFGRKKPLVEATLERIYAGLIKFVAGGKDAFLVKYNSVNKRTGKHIPPSIDEPCPTVATQNRLGLAKVSFLSKQFSGDPMSKNVSVEAPAGAITCKDHHAFISAYYGNGHNHSIDGASPTLTTKDRLSIIQTERFIDMQYGNGTPASLEEPANTVTTNPKFNLVSVKRHYLLNPQYKSPGGSVDKPCFTLIARMDKMPPYLVATESGEAAIEVYTTDSPMTAKIKEFMALYGIVDIKMRMLKVPELKKIMGFPDDYVLVGTQAEQKKYIGNAVEVTIARRWCEALCAKLKEHFKNAA